MTTLTLSQHIIADKDKHVQLPTGEWAIRTLSSGFTPAGADYIAATYPTTSTEVYTFKSGGSGGTTLATVTVTYTDATKAVLSSVERT